MTLTYSPLGQVLRLADAHDLNACLECHFRNEDELGTLDGPLRDSGNLTPEAVEAVALFVNDHAGQRLDDPEPFTRDLRIRVMARVVSQFLPPVRKANDGRFAVTLHDDGHLPEPIELYLPLSMALTRLAEYLNDHLAGEYVDPNAVAGAVANIHDIARMLVVIHEMSR